MSDISNPPNIPSKPSTRESRALGAFWRCARRAAGMTLGDVAKVLGCSVSRASDIEIGEETPTAREMELLGPCLGPCLLPMEPRA